MNARDLGFFNLPQKSTSVETVEKAKHGGSHKRGPLSPALEACWPIVDDRFLRVIERISQIASHRKLFELLQREVPVALVIVAIATSHIPRSRQHSTLLV